MIDVFIGNYERIIGHQVFIKEKEYFRKGILMEYLFKSIKKYVVKLEDGRTIKTDKVYINY